MTDFYLTLSQWAQNDILEELNTVRESDVIHTLERAKHGTTLDIHDFLTLLAPSATRHLEAMAQLAQGITRRTFGRAIHLFTPLYLANHCTNRCVYCGFNNKNAIKRTRLTLEEIEREGAVIAATGLRHILLLTGDSRQKSSPDYIAEAARCLRKHFPGISIEVYALTMEEYTQLRQAGVDGMTMFQETYNETLYPTLHPSGPKNNFHFRLEAPTRAAAAGFRSVNIGALLGLDVWRRDAFFTGLHAHWLQQHYPAVETAVSVPRMRPHVGIPCNVHDVSDIDLVQYIVALRIFLPMTGITVSSRERPALRDRLLDLGVTRVSAGVSTRVGGHAENTTTSDPQFHIADNRNVDEMLTAIRTQGYQPILKNWEPLDGNI